MLLTELTLAQKKSLIHVDFFQLPQPITSPIPTPTPQITNQVKVRILPFG